MTCGRPSVADWPTPAVSKCFYRYVINVLIVIDKVLCILSHTLTVSWSAVVSCACKQLPLLCVVPCFSRAMQTRLQDCYKVRT
jgi:hypothetical protein